ncbi:MAG: hypothetical protein KDC05_17620, partial [Bacteroidales bacterium]|nr:hypothetical protein [Bacteroidales bacterium]
WPILIKFVTVSFLLFFINTNLSSQIPVGLKHDINGIPFNGYFDPMIYSPDEKISSTINEFSYERGYYFDASGNKVTGLIKYEENRIFFKEGKKEFRDKIKADEIKNFVTGVDSFFTIDNYIFENKVKTDPVYVHYISSFDNFTFVRHYSIRREMNKPIVFTFYLFKENTTDVWQSISNETEFRTEALKLFNHVPVLNEKITAGKYGLNDMMTIIKTAEYLDAFENAKPIYFDIYWQETGDPERASYNALITDVNDSIFTFEYYHQNRKIYTVNYSSFYPNIKEGDVTAYHPNGQIRQIATFEQNKPTEVKLFDINGGLYIHYKYVETEGKRRKDTNLHLEYLFVADSLGNNILVKGKKSSVTAYDAVSDATYTTQFYGHQIIACYRVVENDTIFQMTDPGFNLSIEEFQNVFNYYISKKDFEDAMEENAQGIILLSLLIDDKGYVQEGRILNNIHPQLDSIITNLLSERLIEGASFRYSFKPYRRNKERRFCEFVIPVELNINRFYRSSPNYNLYSGSGAIFIGVNGF